LSADRLTAIITSPNYPSNYPHNVDCTWTVTAPTNRKVQLQFIGDVFSIESHTRSVRHKTRQMRRRPSADIRCGRPPS